MKFLSRLWIKKSIRDILNQKLLFFALILLCLSGTGSFVALYMGFTNLEYSYARIYRETNFADSEINTLNDVWFNTTEIQEVVDNFTTNHPEIDSINFRLITDTGYNLSSQDSSRSYLLSGRAIGIDTSLQVDELINGFIYDQGSGPLEDSSSDLVFLESHFAQKFRLKPNSKLNTKICNQTYLFRIQAIVYSPDYLIVIPSKYDFLPTSIFGVIYLPIEQLQQFSNHSNQANNILIKMQDGIDLQIRNQIIGDFHTLLNDYTQGAFSPPVMQENQVSNLALHLDLETFEEIALILPVIILGVAAVSIYITSGRLVQSQKRTIGLASCLGYLQSDILLHFVTFSFIIGSTGSILGVIFGSIISGLITWVYAYFLRFPQIVDIQPQVHVMLFASLIGITVSVISGIIPSWRASQLEPREALHININTHKGSKSVLEKILRVNPFGLLLTIPLRNLFRKKVRSSATVIAIAAAVMILVVAIAFIESVSLGVNKQFTEISDYDVIIKFDDIKFADLGVKNDLLNIKKISGIVTAEPVFQIPSFIEKEGYQKEVLITAWNSSSPNAHKFNWASPMDNLSSDRLVICSALANQLNLYTGDIITFTYPRIPDVDLAYTTASIVWTSWSSYGLERARNETLRYLGNLIEANTESISFSEQSREIRLRRSNISISGVSKEIWDTMVHTTMDTITSRFKLNQFKESFNIDLSPYSQIIVKVTEPNNVTLLDQITEEIGKIEGIRSVEYGHDFRNAVNMMMAAFNAVIGIFLLFSCALAALAIFTTIYVNFQERLREIATMLTLGISDNEFLLMMSVENLIQAIFGIIVGIPWGISVSKWLLDNILRTFYFEIIIQSGTWIVLCAAVLAVVLLSQVPAVYNGLKLDLPVVTKELVS